MEKYLNDTILVTIDTKMVTILKSGALKILQLFYENKKSSLHFREIVRKTKLHEPSTASILKLLHEESILKSQKVGNQKHYMLQLNTESFLWFEQFDYKRFQKLPSIRKNAYHYFMEALSEKPLIVLLFGSTARGTSSQQSDIDLLLITNSKIDLKKAQEHVETLTGIQINAIQMTLSSFQKELKLKEEPVIQSALATGYPLFNHIYFYEVLFNES